MIHPRVTGTVSDIDANERMVPITNFFGLFKLLNSKISELRICIYSSSNCRKILQVLQNQVINVKAKIILLLAAIYSFGFDFWFFKSLFKLFLSWLSDVIRSWLTVTRSLPRVAACGCQEKPTSSSKLWIYFDLAVTSPHLHWIHTWIETHFPTSTLIRSKKYIATIRCCCSAILNLQPE